METSIRLSAAGTSGESEVAVVVRYLEFIETTFITFVRDIEGFAWNEPPANNYIDELVDQMEKILIYEKIIRETVFK